MEVRLTISDQTAIEDGHAQSGTFRLQITDEFVAALDAEERTELADLVRLGAPCGLQNWWSSKATPPEIRKASLPALVEYIRQRVSVQAAAKIEHDAEVEAEKMKKANEWIEKGQVNLNIRHDGTWWYTSLGNIGVDPDGLPEDLRTACGLMAQQLERVTAGRNAENARKRVEAEEREKAEAFERKFQTTVWIDQHGTDSMKQRFLAGLLPERELLDAVRDQVFDPLTVFERYARLTHDAARHGTYCYGDRSDIRFDVEDAEELTEEEYARLLEIADIVEGLEVVAKVQAREHFVWCDGAGCPNSTRRRSALVTAQWQGRTLTREYALTQSGQDTLTD